MKARSHAPLAPPLAPPLGPPPLRAPPTPEAPAAGWAGDTCARAVDPLGVAAAVSTPPADPPHDDAASHSTFPPCAAEAALSGTRATASCAAWERRNEERRASARRLRSNDSSYSSSHSSPCAPERGGAADGALLLALDAGDAAEGPRTRPMGVVRPGRRRLGGGARRRAAETFDNTIVTMASACARRTWRRNTRARAQSGFGPCDLVGFRSILFESFW